MSGKSKALKWLGHTIFDLGDVVAKVKYPDWKRYYHGTRNPIDMHNLKKSTYRNIGLHMSDDPKVAAKFAGFGDIYSDYSGKIYKFYAPNPTLEIIDIGTNNINALMGTLTLNPGQTYHATKNSNLLFDAIKKYSGKNDIVKHIPPTISEFNPLKLDMSGQVDFRVTDSIVLPLQEIVWPNRPYSAKKRLSDIWDLLPDKFDDRFIGKDISWSNNTPNDLAADVLSDFGYKVVKYENRFPFEGPKTAYFLTDPKSIYIPPSIPIKTWHLGAGLGTGALGGYLWNKKDQQ